MTILSDNTQYSICEKQTFTYTSVLLRISCRHQTTNHKAQLQPQDMRPSIGSRHQRADSASLSHPLNWAMCLHCCVVKALYLFRLYMLYAFSIKRNDLQQIFSNLSGLSLHSLDGVLFLF